MGVWRLSELMIRQKYYLMIRDKRDIYIVPERSIESKMLEINESSD